MRIGLGGEVQGLSLIVEDARHRFYAVLEEEASEVLEALYESPFKLFKELTQSAPKLLKLSWASSIEVGKAPQYDRLKQSLKAWGASHNIDEPWVYEDALVTLWAWSEVDNPRDIDYQLFYGDEKPRDQRLRFARESSITTVTSLPSFNFNFTPNLSSQTLKEEKARFNKELKNERDRYFAELSVKINTGWQEKSNWPDGPHIRPSSHTPRDSDGTVYEKAPNAETMDLYLKWLVYYQIKGWSHEKIRNTYLKDQDKGEFYDLSSISKGINNVAKRIELNLKERDPGGRSRKS